MPSRLDAPVLTVDVGLIHKVDTRNVENLFSMWTGKQSRARSPDTPSLTHSAVFSRCSGSLEEGRRMENLSWRLWNRETFCCEPQGDANATTPAISVSSRTSEGRYSAEIPDLSGSVDSVDEEAIEFDSETSASTSPPVDILPRIERNDSCGSRSRGRERHITPDDLERMFTTIKEKKDLEPLSPSTYSFLPSLAEHTQSRTTPPPVDVQAPEVTPTQPVAIVNAPSSAVASVESQTLKSGTANVQSSTSVVRGFSPSQVSLSYRSVPLLSAPSASPTPKSLAARQQGKKKQNSMFALGGSSGDDSMQEPPSSVEDHRQAIMPKKKPNNMFTLGGSSGEDESSLKSHMGPVASRSSLAESQRSASKKKASFKDEVATRTIYEHHAMNDEDDSAVFETDDEDDIDESAIDDDDDSSEWEDSNEDSGKSSIDDKTFFQRVDSRPNLTSRRSILTTMLHQSDRATALASAASRSSPALHRSRTSSPQGPSLPASPGSDRPSPLMMRSNLQPAPQTGAQPIIMTTTNATPHQLALSPRTTRRNMMSTELTASLRRHLLWERQQKNQTAAAVLKRRHTAHDVANLKQYPEKVFLGTDNKDANQSGEYFGQGLGEYHSKGW